MLNVYICEDEDAQKEKIKTMVENIILMEDLDMRLVLAADNPYKVLDSVRQSEQVGIYFLDVDLRTDMSGLDLAKEIRKIDSRGFIVFITTHSEMSYMTFIYQLEALDFILKDQEDEEIGRRLNKCLHEADQRFSIGNKVQDIFSVKINGRMYTIPYEDILFFETSPTVHKMMIHCKNRQMEFYGTMKDIESSLDNRFYKCHRSYIVNKNNIREINYHEKIIYMVNGEQCLTSARLVRGLRK